MLIFSWLLSAGYASPIQELTNPARPLSCETLQKRGIIETLEDCSLAFTDPNRWKRALKKQNLQVQGTPSPALLSYLYSYFMLVPPQEAFSIRIAKKTGPRRVWKRGNTLFFTKDAADTLLDTQLHGLIHAQKNDMLDPSVGEIELGYSNTLFAQLKDGFFIGALKLMLRKPYQQVIPIWAHDS